MAYLIPQTIPQWSDSNGSPAAGALLYVYVATTLTLLASYTTSALSVSHANPQVADSAGRFANAYIADGSNFKVIVTDSTGATTFHESDNIHAPDDTASNSVLNTYSSKSSDYTVVAGDNGAFIDFDASAGDRVVTVNSATLGNGFNITIGRRSTSGLVTLTPGGGQTIEGISDYIIDSDYEAVTIVSMGAAGWRFQSQTSREPVGELPIINAQTGTTYTPVIADKGAKVTLSNVAAITLTIPSNASVPYPILSRIEFSQLGAGQVTIVAAGGVTLNSFSSWLKILGQNAGVIATKTAVNTWLIEGNLTA